MFTLTVRQKLKNGNTKEWRLKSNQSPYTFGSSRNCDLISIDEKISSFTGLFEFVENQWWYIDLKSIENNKNVRILIDDQLLILPCSNYDLEFKISERQFNMYEKIHGRNNLSSIKNSEAHQLFLIKKNNTVLATELLPFGKKLKKYIGPELIVIDSEPSEDWRVHQVTDFEVWQKSINLESQKHLASMTSDQVMDKNDQKSLYIILSCALILFTLGIFSKKNSMQQDLAPAPKVAQKIILKDPKKMEPNKPKETVKQQQLAQNQPSQSGAAPQAEKFKSFNSGRISQLLSKVSSQAAKSANLIVTKGVKAGEGTSGRALAAIGKIDSGNKDWSSDSKGSQIRIATQGLGGGIGVSTKGVLKSGSTGAADVGLIEDESEVVGGLDREVIAEYIKTQLGQILYCYERQLSANPDLFGKVAVKFTIGGNGKVEQQFIGESTLKNATVEGCILNRVAAWKFPTPQGGTKVLVTYPFLFKSTN